jgi:hypothetical protein
MAIPGVAIPLSTGLNYFMTGRIAKVARQVFRDGSLITELAPELTKGAGDDLLLFLQVASLMVKADGKTTAEESWLLNALADNIASMDGGAKAVASLRG